MWLLKLGRLGVIVNFMAIATSLLEEIFLRSLYLITAVWFNRQVTIVI